MPFIVVGIDGSENAFRALVAAVEQAKLVGAEVRAVSVVVLPAMSGYEIGPVDVEAMTAAATQLVATAVDDLTTHFGGELPAAVTPQVLTGHVGIELLRASQEGEGAAMVVAGARGTGGFESLRLGSVTTYLAHHLACPLLIVPAEPPADV